jgi:pimeloyl-ACP methyl ester carboxylesterase
MNYPRSSVLYETNRRSKQQGVGLASLRQGQSSLDMISGQTDPRLSFLQQFGHRSLAYSSLQEGLDFYLNPEYGYIAYSNVKSGSQNPMTQTTLCLADPICAMSNKRSLLKGFLETFRDPIFLHISKYTAQILDDLGFMVNELGIETILDIQKFCLIGKKKEFLRSQFNRAQKDGLQVIELDETTVSPESLRSISDKWRKNKVVSYGELSFITRPMVYSDEFGARKFYVLKDGFVIGFVVFDPIYNGGLITGYLANILRTDYKSSYSVTDFVILEALKKFKSEGLKELSLGFSPFCDIDDSGDFRFSKLLKQIFRYSFENANYIYNFKELSFHKKRYRPDMDGVREVKVYCAAKNVFPLWRLYAILCFIGFRPVNQTIEHIVTSFHKSCAKVWKSIRAASSLMIEPYYTYIKLRFKLNLAAGSLLSLLIFSLITPRGALPDESINILHTDHYVTADGAKLHYVESGSGQPIVLLHGNYGTLQDFTMSIFDRLASKYRTLAFDRPGHGASTQSDFLESTPETQARIIHSALKELGIVRPLVVAHSWSGSLALSYALQFPNDLSGLVLLGGIAYNTKDFKPKFSYYVADIPIAGTIFANLYKFTSEQKFEKILELAFEPQAVPEQYKKEFMSSLLRTSQLKAAARDEITLNKALKKMRTQYGKITIPVVIVTGDSDQIVKPKEQSYQLHKAIPQSKLIVIHQAGHEIQFTRPDEVIRAIDLAVQASVPQSNSTATTAHSQDNQATDYQLGSDKP